MTLSVSILAPDRNFTLLAGLTFLRLSATRVISGVGALAIEIPRKQLLFPPPIDSRIAVFYRGGLFASYLLRGIGYRYDGSSDVMILYGLCYNSLIDRRIVAYHAGSPQSSKTGAWDDVMRAFVRENLGSDAGSSRSIMAYGFAVEDDQSIGGEVTVSAAWRPLREALQETASLAAKIYGDKPLWDITPTLDGWRGIFRVGNRFTGADRRVSRQGAKIITPEAGNIKQIVYEVDHRDERNVVIAAGQGEGISRAVITVADDQAVSQSILNRCETFVDGRSAGTTEELQAIANAALARGKYLVNYQIELAETALFQYGRDVAVGDLVTVQYIDAVDALVRRAELRADADKTEISLSLEAIV